jgi:hypothetical protein
MAAKNKPRGRPQLSRRFVPDVREVFALHLEASQRLDHLLEQVRELKAAGKIAEARRVFKHAEQIQQQLLALEQGYRRPPQRPGQ